MLPWTTSHPFTMDCVNYSPQDFIRAAKQDMKPALQEYQENFISELGSVHWRQGFLQCFDPLKFSFDDSLLCAKPNLALQNNVLENVAAS